MLDKLKIAQAIANLVRNAIEASPAGGEVVVQASARDGWAEVVVQDHGPGVPEPERDAVFMPFYTTKEHGTGLGLAIARELTAAHGGTLTVAPGAAPGATFVLRLPLRPVSWSRPRVIGVDAQRLKATQAGVETGEQARRRHVPDDGSAVTSSSSRLLNRKYAQKAISAAAPTRPA